MSPFSFSLREVPPPDAAVELAAPGVSAATLEMRGGQRAIAAYAVEPLPEGALVPSLTSPNARDKPALVAALKHVLERVGRPRRIGLILPDPVVKVSLLRFEQVPPRAQDLEQLIRWQTRKVVPFPIDEAQISYVNAETSGLGHQFIVSVARREIVQEYEQLCDAAGAYAGLVDISTFSVINTVLAGSEAPSSDWLLVNVAFDWASIAILRGSQLVVFRSRRAEVDGTLTDLVHQTAMYYEDRLQGAGFTRALLCGASTPMAQHPGGADEVRRGIEEQLGMSVDTVDVRAVASLTDRITASPSLLATLAPLAGLLLRGNEA